MDKRQKLLDRPIDVGTQIQSESFVDFGDFIGLLQVWTWNGIKASSVIILYEDVMELKGNELVSLVFHKMGLSDRTAYSFKHSLEYVHINYGFEIKIPGES